MEFKRTPEERFENLQGYSFAPNYMEIDDTEGGLLRLHYLDKGPRDGKIILLMHGQPMWSYLYRDMIPLLVDSGYRVIAPDLIGFGRSDKPTQQSDHTYARHVTWIGQWFEKMNVSDVTVFLQDWGANIGLRIVANNKSKFSSVVLSNGGLVAGPIPSEMVGFLREAYKTLPVVKASELDGKFRDRTGFPGFLYWRKFAAESSEFLDISCMLDQIGSARKLTDSEKLAFNAPFPDESFMAAVRVFPSLVPLFPDDAEVEENKQALSSLTDFDKPFLLAFSDDDPVSKGLGKAFLQNVPGCKDMPHRRISPAGHFVQQDQPEQCVEAIRDVLTC
ncbi:haloalkane dehalogenase [Glaciecola petra]|uniref:Haloalkane dehalogenase n=1 Tax=Glaciecola petra TaxID=3075602 RepID=A0ABU2ZW09_9ALTE|nr:haloalkane dehalogenase [Aestuariibacter sp. P117]MDT0596484.1 haloalkane dehalogenase [Aestuariibacter sp. P117]